MKAAIIAGGLARRLRPVTEEIPKALISVAGKPIIEWQIRWLKKYGINTVVVLSGYLHEKIIKFLGSGNKFGVRVIYSIEETPLGTGGALKNAEDILSDDIFVTLNGDIITTIDLQILINSLKSSSEVLMSMALVPLKSPYGIVEIDSKGYIKAFKEKPVLRDYLINAGVYVMKPEIFRYIPSKGDLEKITFPRLAKEKKLKGVLFENVYWRSIDTVKDVEEASKELGLQHNFSTENNQKLC